MTWIAGRRRVARAEWVAASRGRHRSGPATFCLHDEEKVQGVTVFRGICGFGKSGKMHSSSLLDMSLDLPLVVEFFDVPEKVNSILEHIRKDIEPGHIVSWRAALVV